SMAAFDVAKEKMRRNPRKIEVIEEIKDFLGKRTKKKDDIMEKFKQYMELSPRVGMMWTKDALARLAKMPPFAQTLARPAVEEFAKREREKIVDTRVLDRALESFGPAAMAAMSGAGTGAPVDRKEIERELSMPWDGAAIERLSRMPIALARAMVVRRVEEAAKRGGLRSITIEFFLSHRFAYEDDR
ncbi:MAG: PCP reductase family protein, partial [Vicinamibacteria bacterium]